LPETPAWSVKCKNKKQIILKTTNSNREKKEENKAKYWEKDGKRNAGFNETGQKKNCFD
jgi:hypothetical protein